MLKNHFQPKVTNDTTLLVMTTLFTTVMKKKNQMFSGEQVIFTSGMYIILENLISKIILNTDMTCINYIHDVFK